MISLSKRQRAIGKEPLAKDFLLFAFSPLLSLVSYLLTLSLCLLTSCSSDLEKVKEISFTNENIAERGEEVEIHYSEEGHLKAKVMAKELLTYRGDEPYMEFSKGVKLNFFNDHLQTTSKLTANYGIYYTQKEEMLVRDNVEIINIKGEQLDTEELIWRRKDEKIYSDKFVRITTPDEIIYGTGFEAKQDFSDYTIKNISGTVQVKDGQASR